MIIHDSLRILPLFLAILTLTGNATYGQKLTQTLRGTIIDTDSGSPLIGATIQVIHTPDTYGAVSDEEGQFRIQGVPVGRREVQVSFLGYESKLLSNVVVNSGKEVILQISLEESTIALDDIVIAAYKTKGDPVNEMSTLSTISISTDETSRYAGSFNDPSRIVTSFAGVATGNDGDNEIIVRGNSPKYLQWRLDGIEISNPSHFADQNSVRGGISALNNNLLATSDFTTGAFSAEYGNVLSGVFDVKLRAGNNENFESTFGFGLLGTDITLEGPLKKGYSGSYLLNYRYSTIGLINQLGLVNIDGLFNFQDAMFKILVPTKKLGVISLFALRGSSDFEVDNVAENLLNTPGDQPSGPNIIEDYYKSTNLLNIGLNHSIAINTSSHFKTSLSYSQDNIHEDVFESEAIPQLDHQGNYLKDTFENKTLDYVNRLKRSTSRLSITYKNKINSRQTIQIGSKYNILSFTNEQSWFQEQSNNRFIATDFSENIHTVSNFINWKSKLSHNIRLIAGVHNYNVLFNNKSTIEPRLAMTWKINKSHSFKIGYGLHSQMESVHNYFSIIDDPNGPSKEPNRNLDLLKAHHFVAGYDHFITPNLKAKVELYYQHLFNLPVENNPSSTYATINEQTDFRYVDLVNEGTGKNYGIELTLEQYFHKEFYFLINGSIFSSKYRALENVMRNTRYNGNYIVNILFGKDFEKLGKKKNRSWSLNAKIFFGGGKNQLRLNTNLNGQVSVDPSNNVYWNEGEAYETKLDDLYQVTLSASYKVHRHSSTHEIFINLDNVSNAKGRISEYYDANAPNSTGYVRQFGLFPNLMYRVYF